MSVSKKRTWKTEPGRKTEMPLQFKVEVRKESLSWVHNLEMELLSESWVRYQRVLFITKCSVLISSYLASHHHVPSRLTSVATLPWSQDQPAHLVLLSPLCPLAERNLGLAFCWEPAPVPWCWWSALSFAKELGFHLWRGVIEHGGAGPGCSSSTSCGQVGKCWSLPASFSPTGW